MFVVGHEILDYQQPIIFLILKPSYKLASITIKILQSDHTRFFSGPNQLIITDHEKQLLEKGYNSL